MYVHGPSLIMLSYTYMRTWHYMRVHTHSHSVRQYWNTVIPLQKDTAELKTSSVAIKDIRLGSKMYKSCNKGLFCIKDKFNSPMWYPVRGAPLDYIN